MCPTRPRSPDLGRGRCLMTLGLAEEAAAPLRQALGAFTRLGARPAVEEALALTRLSAGPD